jgi:cation:H+ antiporter
MRGWLCVGVGWGLGSGGSAVRASMTVGSAAVYFVIGAVVSLATSWVLVIRLERVGERLGLSEALLGMVAALAADAPEITASISALVHHQRTVSAGVVIGSNVFNLAALLGLGAVVAGRIELHRKVVVLGGSVGIIVSVACLLAVTGVVSAEVALTVVLVVLVPYLIVLSVDHVALGRLRLPSGWAGWLTTAVVEEESELDLAVHPERGTKTDAYLAGVALLVVVVASTVMERGASALGRHYDVADIVVGGLVLAAVTSLPNAVAAVYLAGKGRGAAALSTALNSNTINVTAGLLIPATIIGLAKPTGSGLLVAGWYVGLTVLTLTLAYAGRGLRRAAGWLIIAAYAVFVALLLLTS